MKKFISFAAALGMGIAAYAATGNNTVLNANDPAIRYTGRTQVLPDGSVAFDWSGTYLETRLQSRNLDLKVSDTKTNYYDVFIDGKLHKVVKTCGTDTVINFVSGLDRRPHSLRIQKRSEGEAGKTTFHNFILDKNGSLSEEPRTRTRHIEFIGNSLTCGFGTEGENRDEPYKVETENCNLSYSTIIPRYFNADYTLIAHSGRGAVRNWGDSVRVSRTTMKDKMMQTFDEDTLPKWDFAAGYRPDLVIINLGSNDFSLEPQPYKSEFVKAYTQILKQIREGYGNVPVICVYSCTVPAPVYSYFEAALAEMNDPDIHLVSLPAGLLNTTTDLGSVWHPNYNGQRKMAMVLIPQIATIMDWEITGAPVE